MQPRRRRSIFSSNFCATEGVADQPGQYGVFADCPFLQAVDRRQLEEMAGLWFEVTRERAAGAKVGISQMDWALADTGTLVQDATAIDKRLVSTLPTIHVALIATSGLAARHARLAGRGSDRTPPATLP